MNAVIGGNSIYFLIPSYQQETKKLMLLNEFKGDYPLFDVTVSIEKLRYKDLGGRKAKYEKDRPIELLNLGTVYPTKS